MFDIFTQSVRLASSLLVGKSSIASRRVFNYSIPRAVLSPVCRVKFTLLSNDPSLNITQTMAVPPSSGTRTLGNSKAIVTSVMN